MSKKERIGDIDLSRLQTENFQLERQSEEVSRRENADFIQEHMKVVETVSAGFVSKGRLPTGVVYDDMVSWGIEGLLKARKNFNADKGASFRTYANFRVRGEILDNLRKEWAFRFPSVFKSYQDRIQERIIDVLENSLSEKTTVEKDKRVTDLLSNSAMVYILSSDDLGDAYVSELEDSDVMEETLESEEDKSIVWDEVDGLDDEEQLIVKMFYKQNLTQKMISEKLKLSRSKICRLHEQILQKLKRRVERRFQD